MKTLKFPNENPKGSKWKPETFYMETRKVLRTPMLPNEKRRFVNENEAPRDRKFSFFITPPSALPPPLSLAGNPSQPKPNLTWTKPRNFTQGNKKLCVREFLNENPKVSKRKPASFWNHHPVRHSLRHAPTTFSSPPCTLTLRNCPPPPPRSSPRAPISRNRTLVTYKEFLGQKFT